MQGQHVNIEIYIYMELIKGKRIKWRCIKRIRMEKLMLSDQILCKRRVMMQNIPGIKTTSELKEDPIAGQNHLETWMNSAGQVIEQSICTFRSKS